MIAEFRRPFIRPPGQRDGLVHSRVASHSIATRSSETAAGLPRHSYNLKSRPPETTPARASNPAPAPAGLRGAAFRHSAEHRAALRPSAAARWCCRCQSLRPPPIPAALRARWQPPRRQATTTCFGGRSARRTSVNAMSTTGTMVPRKLKTPIRNGGDSGRFVNRGHSTTSSTSSTCRQ